MKLSHTTKVTVRKALAAMRKIAERQRTLEDQGFQLIDSPTEPKPATQIARKAGFRNRTDLEKFARKHNLL